ISINELIYKSDVASVNSFAITLAIEYAGLKSEAEISGLLPMTIVTAIVSPIALPKPSNVAPTIPDRAFERIILVVSHFVAPIANAASLCKLGIDCSTSHVIAVIIGRT